MIPLSRVTVTEEMKRAILEVVDSGSFILGSETEAFEKEFAAYIGTEHAVAVSSGTSALQLAITAIGVEPGDEVLVPSLTAFPTVEAVLNAGATPVFVDLDRHYGMDVEDAERKVTRKTVGIVPVHLYGGVADLDGLADLASRKNLWLVEDCCQAHGALHGERKVGSIGRAGCFSFYPSKNLTVFGDGGMVTTNDRQIAERVRRLRDHGRADKHTHVETGFNFRFNEIQAAVGRRQLALLEKFIERRREIASRYDAAFSRLPELSVPREREGTRMVYHLYPIRCPDEPARDGLKEHLERAGIGTGIHYPIPCHLQPATLSRMSPPSLPRTEEVARTILSLPMFPSITNEEVETVVQSVARFFQASD